MPVDIEFVEGAGINDWINTLPMSGKDLGDVTDVLDQEESWYLQIKALNWLDKIDKPEYAALVPMAAKMPETHVFDNGLGLVNQLFEGLQPVVRKDKVNVSEIDDWPDFANPKYRKSIITYPLEEERGQMILLAIINSLVQNGIIEGELWDQQTMIRGLKWYRDNLKPNIYRYAQTGEMRTMMQSGEASICFTWCCYARELGGTEWNQRDNVIAVIFPKSGLPIERQTFMIAKGAKHPVAARILVNWMLDKEFQLCGWYKDSPESEAVNHWGVTKRQFLAAHFGGLQPEFQKLRPDWANDWYPEDTDGKFFKVNAEWYLTNKTWLYNKFVEIVGQ